MQCYYSSLQYAILLNTVKRSKSLNFVTVVIDIITQLQFAIGKSKRDSLVQVVLVQNSGTINCTKFTMINNKKVTIVYNL